MVGDPNAGSEQGSLHLISLDGLAHDHSRRWEMLERGNALSGFADVNGTRLYYELAGSGTPVVFIHGFSLDTRMWDDQFETFAQQFQVLRYDLRGFGKSALPARESYGHEADLKALLTHLGVGQAHIVGLSLGGAIAVDFALAYPELVQSLIPVDAGFHGFRFSQEWDTRTGLVWEIATRSGIPLSKQSWLDHPLFAPIREQSEASHRLEKIVSDYSGWHFINNNPAVLPEPPAAQRLNHIHAPTLVVIGERDLPDFHQMADEMQQHIAGARKVILPYIGHMANMEDPVGFNHAVLEFLMGV
jgi:3-oxoadipate enol-lactonase